jgi:hypothetical protein
MIGVHKGKAARAIGGTHPDEPARFKADCKAEPAHMEIAAFEQLRRNDVKVEILSFMRLLHLLAGAVVACRQYR